MRFFSITSDFQQKWKKMMSTENFFFFSIYQYFFHFFLFYHMVLVKIRGRDAPSNQIKSNQIYLKLTRSIWTAIKQNSSNLEARRGGVYDHEGLVLGTMLLLSLATVSKCPSLRPVPYCLLFFNSTFNKFSVQIFMPIYLFIKKKLI